MAEQQDAAGEDDPFSGEMSADLGFAGRRVGPPVKDKGRAKQTAQETVQRAAATLAAADEAGRKGAASAGKSPRKAPRRAPAEQAADRAWQAMLGTVLPTRRDIADKPVEPAELAAAAGRIPANEAEQLAKLAAHVKERAAAAPSEAAAGDAGAKDEAAHGKDGLRLEVTDELEKELAARGIALSMSGRVNNVYITGSGSTLTVHPSTEGDRSDEPGGGTRSYRRPGSNYFGQLVARKLQGFIKGG